MPVNRWKTEPEEGDLVIPPSDEYPYQTYVTPEPSYRPEIATDAIITYTGRVVRPLDPDPETIDIEDIAHALSNQCRFTGHVKSFYSVAQHSVYVSQLCPPEDALWGLLHDASEAYLSDLARPLKYTNGLGDVYREAEAKLTLAIAMRFDLFWQLGEAHPPLSVKNADDLMLVREAIDLMPENFPLDLETYVNGAPVITPWSPRWAKIQFLHRYRELT